MNKFMKYLFIIILILSCEAGAIPLYGVETANRSFKIINRSEDELLLCSFVVDKKVLSNAIPIFLSDKDTLVPMGIILSLLELPIYADPESGVASGFYDDTTDVFYLNVSQNIVKFRMEESVIDSGAVEVHTDDIYVRLSFLEPLFKWKFEFDKGNANLILKPKKKLAIQRRWEREVKSTYLTKEQWRYLSTYDKQPHPFTFLSPFSSDISISTNWSRIEGQKFGKASSVYRGVFTADAGYLNGYVNYNYYTDQKKHTIDMAFGRVDPNAELLGPLCATSFLLGNIPMPTSTLFPSGGIATGLTVSNHPTTHPLFLNYHTFEGMLREGWDVELYRDDRLYEFCPSNKDNRYIFNEIPLFFGSNKFKLVFHGPLGETEEEEQEYNIGDNALPPGSMYYYLAGADQYNVKRGYGKIELGITNQFTVNFSGSSLALNNGRRHYAGIGFSAFMSSMMINPSAAYDFQTKKTSYEIGLQSNLFGMQFNSSLNHPPKYLLTNGNLRENDIKDKYSAAIDNIDIFGQGFISPFTLSYTGFRNNNGSRYDLSGLAFSLQVARLSLGNFITWKMPPTVSTLIDPRVMYVCRTNLRVDPISFYGSTQWSILPKKYLYSADLTAELNISDRSRFSLTVNSVFVLKHSSAGINWQNRLGLFTFGLFANYTNKQYGTVGITLSLSSAIEPREFSPSISENSDATLGLASAAVFIDANNNKIWDEGEKGVPNVSFFINDRNWYGTTDDEGISLLRGIPKNQYVEIAISRASLENPQLTPTVLGMQFVPRPGKAFIADFPVIVTTEISGHVFLKKQGSTRPISGVRVELIDSLGAVIKDVVSAYDGFYNILEIPLGKYYVRINPDFVARMNYTNARVDFEIANEWDVFDKLDLVLEAVEMRPKDIKPIPLEIASNPTDVNKAPAVIVKKTEVEDVIKLDESWTLEGVKFKFDKYDLDPVTIYILDSALVVLKKYYKMHFEIQGHTDNRGTFKYNQRLSENRAKTVLKWFIDHGIAPERLTSKGFSFSKPKTTNSTDEGRHTNRRIDLFRTE